MDAQYFLERNPPWTSLLGTGRLLVFHFLSSIKDLEPKLFSNGWFRKHSYCFFCPRVLSISIIIPTWTVIRPWTLINFESFPPWTVIRPWTFIRHLRVQVLNYFSVFVWICPAKEKSTSDPQKASLNEWISAKSCFNFQVIK